MLIEMNNNKYKIFENYEEQKNMYSKEIITKYSEIKIESYLKTINSSTRSRTFFTKQQKEFLEKIFKEKKNISRNEILRIAEIFDTTPKIIKTWFNNRRYKEKRKNCENPMSLKNILN